MITKINILEQPTTTDYIIIRCTQKNRIGVSFEIFLLLYYHYTCDRLLYIINTNDIYIIYYNNEGP